MSTARVSIPIDVSTHIDAFVDSTSPGTPSKNSVRISRSDADNVHLTIASMAVLHQQLSTNFHQQMSPTFHQQMSPTFTACSS